MRMPTSTTQTCLDLRSQGLRSLWSQLPERCREEVVSLLAHLIARAAQTTSHEKGGQE